MFRRASLTPMAGLQEGAFNGEGLIWATHEDARVLRRRGAEKYYSRDINLDGGLPLP